MTEYKTLKKKRRDSPKKTVPFLLHYCANLCTAVIYSNWSLHMGQMGPKMTLGTLTMSGDDFPGVQGVLRGSNSVHDLISDIYRRHSDTVFCSQRGGLQRGNAWSKSFF